MTRTLVTLAATVGIGAVAILAAPFRAITPGTLSPGHERLRNDCFACHAPFGGPDRARCIRCHAPATIGVRTVDGRPRPPGPRLKTSLPGLHAALGDGECYRCHLEHSGRSRAGAGLRFTHAALPEATRSQCATCHSGNRPGDRLHAQVTASCGSCHGSDRWKPATYDHDKLFRFDANHPSRCGDCHDAGGDYRRYDCTRCHEHARERMIAEHREERITDLESCARCHRSGDEHEGRGGRGGEARDGGEGGEGEDDD